MSDIAATQHLPTSTTIRAGDVGDLIIRATAGLFLMPHGAQKLFGWFGGGGLDGTAQFFSAQLGLEPAFLLALAVGMVEFFGGLFLALGLLTRLSALGVVVLMAVATFHVHWSLGFFWPSGGFEYPLFWGLVAVAFVVKGGGALSLDHRVGWKF